MNVVGIDASLTGTAVCILDQDGNLTMSRHGSKPAAGLAARMLRYEQMVTAVRNDVKKSKADLIIIEGYSYGSKGRSVIDLGEYGGLLRNMLLDYARVLEIAPTSVKKYITGSGNAKKLLMATTIAKKYDVEFTTDDEYDAYAIASIAATVMEWCEPTNQHQRDVIASLREQLS